MGLGTKIFCAIIVVVGISEVVAHGTTGLKAVKLRQLQVPTPVQIVGKTIERPGPMRKPRMESLTINGEKVRGLHTYFNQYVLNVRYAGTDGTVTAKAPVNYNRWHDEHEGTTVTAGVSSEVSDFVNVDEDGTLFYALRQFAMGFVIIAVGLVALRFSDDLET